MKSPAPLDDHDFGPRHETGSATSPSRWCSPACARRRPRPSRRRWRRRRCTTPRWSTRRARWCGRTSPSAAIPASRSRWRSDGETVWSEGFGYADLEHRVPMSPSVKFRVGSISKSMTAAAVASLVEKGRLDLDAPVQQYVPSFPEKAHPVTTRQLGGHLGGIPPLPGERELHPRSVPDGARRAVHLCRRPAAARAGHRVLVHQPTASTCSARRSRGRPGSRSSTPCASRCSVPSACATPSPTS